MVAVSDDAGAARRARRRRDGARRRHGRRAGLRRGARARAPPARGRRRRGARPARAQRRLPVRRHRVRHRVRRLRGGFEPHAAHRRRRPLRLRPLRAPLPPPHGRGPRRAPPRPPWRAPARRSRAPRASSTTPPRWRSARIRRPDDPHRTDHPHHRRDRRHAHARPRRHAAPARARTGVGFLDHMLDLLARHGRLDLEVQVTGDLQTGAAPHGRGHRDRARPGARPGARRPARDRPLRPRDRADGRGARRCARSTSPAARSPPSSGFERLPAGDIAGFEHEAGRGVLPRRRLAPRGSRCTSSCRPARTRTT